MKNEYHILNLGAGVQSTTLALLAAEGKLRDAQGAPIVFDAAIFADTMEEPEDPGHSVYEHLEWIERNVSFPVIRRTAGKLGDHLKTGTNSTGGRFASIPAYTISAQGKKGKMRRQCTREYKIDVVERAIRRDVLGLPKGGRIPKTTIVHQYIGISLDEIGRMLRAKKRAEEKPVRWSRMHYPLIEVLGWTRKDCREYLAPRVPHRVPRSACVFCPFHDNEEWAAIKARGGRDWARAVEIDEALRIPGNVVNRKLDQPLFLHVARMPLREIDFEKAPSERSMAGECQGMCGS